MVYYSITDDIILYSALLEVYGKIVAARFSADGKSVLISNDKGVSILYSLSHLSKV
jgi:hypothetical protein